MLSLLRLTPENYPVPDLDNDCTPVPRIRNTMECAELPLRLDVSSSAMVERSVEFTTAIPPIFEAPLHVA